jgi:hypothetical protein
MRILKARLYIKAGKRLMKRRSFSWRDMAKELRKETVTIGLEGPEDDREFLNWFSQLPRRLG